MINSCIEVEFKLYSMDYLFVIASFLIAMYIARVIISKILIISFREKLFDVPDERKVHTHAIPRLGGVSFFPTLLFSLCLVTGIYCFIHTGFPSVVTSQFIAEILFLVCGLTLLYIVGIADDLVGVRYRQKLVVQFICAAFFPLSGLYINNLYGIFGIYEIPMFVGIPLTMLLVIFLTNAINLIDGIDGLASGLSIVSLLVLGTLFLLSDLWVYAMIAFTTFGILLPFFYCNVFGQAERGKKYLWETPAV